MKQSEFLILLVLVATGCTGKKEETVTRDTTSQTSPSLSGARKDSLAQHTVDSVKMIGQKRDGLKPPPPAPVEELTRAQLSDYKKLLKEKGYYNCCIEPDCRMCVLELEECFCEKNVKKKRPVCGECYDGWQAGKGRIKGIKTEDVIKQ
jgi:hypothetical protein